MSKILVANRMPNPRRMMSDYFTKVGYTVIETANGKQTVEQADAEHPDLILVDSNVTGVGVLEVLENLKDNPATRPIPIIVVGDSTKGESAALRAGAAHYLIKPFQTATLEIATKSALRDSQSDDGPRQRDPNRSARRALEAAEASERPTRSYAPVQSPAEEPVPPPARTIGPLTTGLSQLDQLLKGGIPAGSFSLLEGNPSSGKSVLCQHIAYEALGAGSSVAYITAEHTSESLSRQMESIGRKVSRFLQSGRLRIHTLSKPTDGDASSTLIQTITEHCGQGQVVIVDSATDYLRHMDPGSAIDLFHACSNLCADMCTILLTARSYVFDDALLNRLRSLCGAHFNFDEKILGAKKANTVTVTRIRNIDQKTKATVYFNVSPEVGITYVPGASFRL